MAPFPSFSFYGRSYGKMDARPIYHDLVPSRIWKMPKILPYMAKFFAKSSFGGLIQGAAARGNGNGKTWVQQPCHHVFAKWQGNDNCKFSFMEGGRERERT